MTVSQPDGPRFELALERFQQGQAFVYEEIGFCLAPDGKAECRVQSSWRAENVTEATAQEDLARAEAVLDELVERSPSFAKLVEGRERRYVLLDEYGMGATEICRKEDGRIKR